MASAPNSLYHRLGTGAIDFSTDTLKVALFTSSATFDVDTDDLAYSTTNECPATGNYVAGGFALDNVAWTVDDANNRVNLTADNEVISNVTIADYQYIVIYDDSTTPKYIISITDLGSAQSVTNTTLTLTMPNPVFRLNTAP